jgi:sorting nexin-4
MYAPVDWEGPKDKEVLVSTITVKDPIKHGQNSQAFVSYLVVSNHSVRRRFQDFVQLYHWLVESYPQCIIPPLPGKHRLEYVTGDRFSKEFLDKRINGLQTFMDRIQRHPILSKSICLEKFLEADQMALVDTILIPKKQSIFDSVGELMINAFIKINQDQDYLNLTQTIQKSEKNLINIEKTNINAIKLQLDISKQYILLGSSIENLARMETQMEPILLKIGKGIQDFGEKYYQKIELEDLLYLNPLQDYLEYFNSVKSTLKSRDQKKLDVQELEKYLGKCYLERDGVLARGAQSGFGQFFKDYLIEFKGLDPEKVRLDKIQKLEEKVKNLIVARDEAVGVNEMFGKSVMDEMEGFNTNKVNDFKGYFDWKCKSEIEFHEEVIMVNSGRSILGENDG